jgi:AraC family transcriptional regulator, regulatory protein of adaptative response / methylated-DNA-[protein]-cysteine methyltransferase
MGVKCLCHSIAGRRAAGIFKSCLEHPTAPHPMSRSFKPSHPFTEASRDHRRSGEGSEEIRFGLGKSSLGLVLVAASDRGIVSVSIGKEQGALIETLQDEFPSAHLVRERGTLDDFIPHVVDFIDKPAGVFDLPLDMRGTDFQRSVWRAVQKIPFGKTSSYSAIAAQIGRPKAVRAVASSCTKSKFAIIVPTHRVLHKDGTPCGGGGEDNWQRVLIGREADSKVKKTGPATPATKRRAT